jgi:hypothetical protein
MAAMTTMAMMVTMVTTTIAIVAVATIKATMAMVAVLYLVAAKGSVIMIPSFVTAAALCLAPAQRSLHRYPTYARSNPIYDWRSLCAGRGGAGGEGEGGWYCMQQV